MQTKIVILGTGGTIAGTGSTLGYAAAQLGVGQLIAAVPALAGLDLEAEQVAQVDSKDMSFAIWQRLAQRVAFHAQRADVHGIVVTHGTDTLEETAYFLQRVLAPAKPVVLTAAMRPATSLQADGPQNLLDAVTVAQQPGGCGVVCVLYGQVLAAVGVRKLHSYRLDAFGAGDDGPLALVEAGQVRWLRDAAVGAACSAGVEADAPAVVGIAEPAPYGLPIIERAPDAWPRVDIVFSHAGADGALVRAAVAGGARGLVVAATGGGTLHADLEAALRAAQASGVRVLRSSRCAFGSVLRDEPALLPSAGALTPVQARVELLLELLEGMEPPSSLRSLPPEGPSPDIKGPGDL